MERGSIERALLSDAAAEEGWSNLGDWTQASAYVDAARDLALRIGQAAQLKPGDRILDLACGYGASLLLWREVWKVGAMAALDAQASCRRALQALPLHELEVLPYTSITGLWNTAATPLYDAILCVDAAYHFPSAQTFLEDSRRRLRAGGSLVFTTLIKADALSLTGRVFVRMLGLIAHMPQASLLTAAQWQSLAPRSAWQELHIEPLDREVLGGFAHYIARRSRELSWQRKCSVAWLKIWGTARCAAFLYQRGWLRYARITARGPSVQ